MSWKNPPSVLVISGSHDFYRRREVHKAVLAANATGRKVTRLDASEGEVEDFMSGNLFFSEPTTAIVSKPEKLDPEFLEKHAKDKKSPITLVLVYPKDFTLKSDFGKLVKPVPKKHRLAFKKPASYKMEEEAVSFVVSEADRYGKTISKRLADSLVRKAGTDLGILSYEVLKAVMYANALGQGDLLPDIVKGTLSTVGGANLPKLIDALGVGSEKAVARSLVQIRESSSRDPTLQVTTWVGNQATQWLHITDLLKRGADEGELSSRVSVHPYVLKKSLMGPAQRWGSSRLVKLIRSVAKVERAVRSGHIDPWVELEVALIEAVRSLKNG